MSNIVSFGSNPVSAGYTQNKTSYGMIYYTLAGVNYIYDSLAGGNQGSFFPVNLTSFVRIPIGTNLTKPAYLQVSSKLLQE
jgi:hypothetical protein